MKKLASMTGVIVTMLVLSMVSHAELIDRGNGLIYDTDLDITWLQNANYGAGSVYDDGSDTTDGRMSWPNAVAWADTLVYEGYNDWRLPQTRPVNGTSYVYDWSHVGSTDRGENVSAPGSAYSGSTASEMAHMFYNSLGNIGEYDVSGEYRPPNWGLQNTGPFVNLQEWYYWSGTEYAPVSEDAWCFSYNFGSQTGLYKLVGDDNGLHAWAVRDGDVVPVTETISIDIKPGSCPNPLNTKSKGVLPVAILGTDAFDVADIDVASIRLQGVAPIRSSIEDVSTPVSDDLDDCDCTTDGPDGFDDLTLKFWTQEIVAALGPVNDGDEIVLTLTGSLLDGTPIEGQDCVLILKKGK